MKFKVGVALLMLLIGGMLAGAGWNRSQARSDQQAALAGIAKLHQEDVQATITQNVDQLTNLWTDDAVVMEDGKLTQIGKRAIHADSVRNAAQNPAPKDARYTPHIEDVQIVGNTAYEWGYFDAAYSDSHRKPVKVRGRFLRVMRRLPDDEWKFARVMWNLERP